MKQIIKPEGGSVPAGPWSQGVRIGELLFVSGQVGENAQGVVVARDDFRAQAEQALENIRRVIEAAGGTTQDIVKIAAFLTDAKDFPAYNEVRGAFFGRDFPASTSVVVKDLARPEYLIEVEAIAVIRDRAPR